MSAPLLVELFCEELPPRDLPKLEQRFASGLFEQLKAAGLLGDDAFATAFATPRRLGVRIAEVLPRSPDRARAEKLLPVSIGLAADGSPTPPLLKKLAALGLGPEVVPALRRAPDGKAEALFLDRVAPGRPLADVLGELLDALLPKLAVHRNMTYQLANLSSVQFVRPAHRLVALHGADIVPIRVLGLDAGRVTGGHRFLGHPEVVVPQADAYEAVLEADGRVVASFEARRERMVDALRAAAGDDILVAPQALVDEVVALVEWPVVLAGSFDEAFLAVPQECLVLTMQLNQKYFALTDAAGALRNRFLLVSNLESRDPGRIVSGNERVLRARLADARFFYETDLRQPLAARLDALEQVTYHNKLGSVRARVGRVEVIAARIAETLGADVVQARRAAQLAKCDLVTGMVGEFPELQGVMGGYYAAHDGEPAAVSRAIALQYRPRVTAVELGADAVVASLYLADRIEALIGVWGIGLAPTGEKDPYALRRAALGVIDALQSLGPRAASVELREWFELAEGTFASGTVAPGTVDAVLDFVYERARHLLAGEHERATVDAVISLRPPLHDLAPRVDAVTAFRALPEAEALAAANKRIGNILRKNAESAASQTALDPALLQEPAERALSDALEAIGPHSSTLYDAGDYSAALQSLARLREPVDAFFDDVMVMADDPAIRANRLALLAELHALMNRVADLSRLAS